MKTLSQIALVTAIAAAPFAANAELKAMDDASMSAATGQAGLTIELDAKIEMGEVAYQDGGYLAMKDIKIGGAKLVGSTAAYASDRLDNIKMTIDVVGASGGADGAVGGLAATYLTGAAGFTKVGTINDVAQAVTDGDLVIALRQTDTNAPVDFGFTMGKMALAKSTEKVGSIVGGTVLMSNLAIGGVFGPIDIIIHEEAEKMNINAYFTASGRATFDFVNTSVNFAVHNSRGANMLVNAGKGISLAHAQMEIGSAKNAAGVEVLGFDLQDFSGDIDVTNIVIGGTPSIGNLYITDLTMSAYTKIYGH